MKTHHMNHHFPSDLTDGQWELIEPMLPKRWIVERTFGWLSHCRRLSKDYETLPVSSETMIQITMNNLMPHRLQPG